jgi:hypothetical protein
MPLNLVEPSDAVASIYLDSLKDLVPDVSQKAASRHLPAWTLKLEHAAAGGPLDKAAGGGCRFYTIVGDGRVFSCEMTDPGQYGMAKFRNLVEGETPPKFVALMDKPPDVEDFQTRNFEIHLLSIASLFLEAIWLRADDGGEDYILPVVCFYEELLAQPAFKASEFLKLIQPLARERLRASSAAAKLGKVTS